MKPAPFDYFSPQNLPEALSLIAEHGDAGKLLAGGQSLVPTMNFRLAQPAALVDLNRVPELTFLDDDGHGGLRIGAMTRQRTLERSELVARCAPLLHATMPFIAHVQIRNRGTLGGSLAHADPAAELPAVMVALGARWVAAQDFYQGLFMTALESDEILTEVVVPQQAPRAGWAFHEIARRHGDYAIAGVAATVRLDSAGRADLVKLVYLSVGEGPTPAHQAAASLQGQLPTTERITAAARLAAHVDIEPMADIHASVGYRRHLIEVLGARALTDAFVRAGASGA